MEKGIGICCSMITMIIRREDSKYPDLGFQPTTTRPDRHHHHYNGISFIAGHLLWCWKIFLIRWPQVGSTSHQRPSAENATTSEAQVPFRATQAFAHVHCHQMGMRETGSGGHDNHGLDLRGRSQRVDPSQSRGTSAAHDDIGLPITEAIGRRVHYQVRCIFHGGPANECCWCNTQCVNGPILIHILYGQVREAWNPWQSRGAYWYR